MRDVTTCLRDILKGVYIGVNQLGINDSSALQSSLWSSMTDGEQGISQPTVGDAFQAGTFGRKFECIDESGTILDVLTLLTDGQHRVAVVNEIPKDEESGEEQASTDVLYFVSQSDVIRFFAVNPEILGHCGQVSLSDLLSNRASHRIGPEVVAIDESDLFIHALDLLQESGLSALGVLRGDTLVGMFSTSDIRELFDKETSVAHALHATINEILGITRRFRGAVSAPLVKCHPWDTVERAVEKLAAARAHRVFVVDRYDQPIGIISLNDVVRWFLLTRLGEDAVRQQVDHLPPPPHLRLQTRSSEGDEDAQTQVLREFQAMSNVSSPKAKGECNTKQGIQSRAVVIIPPSLSVRDAYELLARENLSTVPVMKNDCNDCIQTEARESGKAQHEYIGFFDLFDLVECVLRILDASTTQISIQVLLFFNCIKMKEMSKME